MAGATSDLITLTAQIAAAYASDNAVSTAAFPGLIQQIHQSLTDVSSGGERQPAASPLSGEALVDVRRSVFADHLVCLACGMSVKILKRHLMAAHGMTPDQYRTKWKLPAHYPLIAPDYAKTRSRLARASGLGKRR
jgi:predicted transcriptional regulator